MKKEPAVILLVDSGHGVYIPQFFAESCDETIWKVKKDDIQCLQRGPYGGFYWDTWISVLDNATATLNGDTYHLHQSEHGDLWALCYDRMSDEEKENFGFENDYGTEIYRFS